VEQDERAATAIRLIMDDALRVTIELTAVSNVPVESLYQGKFAFPVATP
jgi:hypothetical protein